MKQQNQKELEKIAEEYGDMFPNIFMDLYNKAIGDAPYRFSYILTCKLTQQLRILDLKPKSLKEIKNYFK